MADTEVPEVEEPMAMTWSIGRVLAVIAALTMIAFWAWIFAGGPRKANPDRLEDRAWVETAVARCDQMLEQFEQLPTAAESETPAERSQQLTAANALLTSMIDDLERTAPTGERDREVLDPWFADWRTLLADRATFAAAVENDPAAVFHPTENTDLGRGVDETVKIFADVNDMPECRPTTDVG
jgi:hypothetical protein